MLLQHSKQNLQLINSKILKIMIPVVRTYRRNPLYMNNLLNDEFFGGKMENLSQNVNIAESDNGYRIDLVAPGFERSEIKVTIDKNKLTIASLQEENKDKEESKEKFVRKEFVKKPFSKTFELPENSDLEKIEASHKNGILSIAIAKKAKVEIPVQEIKVK